VRNQWDLHPEWGYLAPSPGFIRTARAVGLATVVGVLVGGSLIAWVSHSGTETSVAARTLVNAPVEPSPAPSQDHVVHAIIPSPQSALASVEDPLVDETATELSADSTTKATEGNTGKSPSAAKPLFTARLPRARFTAIKKPPSRTNMTSRYASRHEPIRLARGQYYMRKSSDEYRASDARGGYYRESRHWGGYYGGGWRAYEDW
jgi:hypothetical protein